MLLYFTLNAGFVNGNVTRRTQRVFHSRLCVLREILCALCGYAQMTIS